MATIAEIASGDDFTTLLGAIIAVDLALPGTNLVDTLSNTQDLTVFAPNDAAFADLASGLGYTGDTTDPDAVLDFLAETLPAEVLRDVILYHVLGDSLTAAEISANPELTSLLGVSITANLPSLIDQDPDFADPMVIAADVVADNGIVHVIDKVLLPLNVEVGDDGRDFIQTGDDADLILAQGGRDRIHANDGNDIILAGDGRDYVDGGDGNDLILGQDGSDRLYGRDGDDTINGGEDSDFVSGGRGDDTLLGGEGWDALYGGSGNDTISGGDDGDHLSGGRGDDTLSGDDGSDGLYGGSGDDTLDGGDGSDYLSGGWGDDTLIAGEGHDSLSGGYGADTFIFDQEDDYNVIYGFGWGDDKIDLSAFEIATFDDLEDRFEQYWTGTYIDLGEGTDLFLFWVSADHLEASDFIL